MQLISASFMSEVAQSIGLEIMIFAITVVVAVAFRRGKRRGSFVQQQKLADPFPEIVKPAQRKAASVSSSNNRERQQPRVQADSASNDVSQRVSSMLELATRRRPSEAMEAYEELRTSCRQDLLKAFLCCRKHSPTEIYVMLTQCAVRAGRPALIAQILDDMEASGVQRSLTFYESTMKLLASKKCYAEAMSVYNRLEAENLKPSPVTLSCLINFAVEIGELDRAIGFFDQLATTSAPSIRAYMMILRVHSKRQDWTKSVDVIQDMQRRGVQIDHLVLNVVLATGVAACQFDGALALLERMADFADVVSYNTVMKGFAQQKQGDRAILLLEAMRQSVVKPNAITFNTAMDAAVRSSRLCEAWSVLEQMREAGLTPDKFTCTTLMKGLQEGAKSEQLTVILDILRSVKWENDSAVCTSLFRSVIEQAGQVNDPALTARAIAQMREQRVMLPPQEYQRLLRSLAHSEDARSK